MASGDPRARVVEIATLAIGRGPDVCASAAPGYVLGKPDGVAWCQVFWLWCLREAGLTDHVWPSGPEWPRAWLPRTDNPQAGDMAYRDQPFQHGAVVVSVTGDRVRTIDGNSVGGVVMAHDYGRAQWDRFYSIAPLLEEPPATNPVNPTPAVVLQRALTEAGYPCGKVDGVIGPKTRAALEAWALRHPEAILP